MKERNITAVTGAVNYRTAIRTDHHELVADEPLDLGGQDNGPDPMTLAMAALAACTGITLKMYADRKQWDFGEITVTVHQESVAGRPVITRTIHVTGNLDSEQRDRLQYIAKACPVSKMIESATEIETRVAD
jgi:putative redox protein